MVAAKHSSEESGDSTTSTQRARVRNQSVEIATPLWSNGSMSQHLRMTITSSLAMAACVVVACLFLTARPAHACRCIGSPSNEEAFAKSEAVFVGRATKVTPIRNQEQITSAVFDVVEARKGVSSKIIELVTESQSAACGFSFAETGVYLVYAD